MGMGGNGDGDNSVGIRERVRVVPTHVYFRHGKTLLVNAVFTTAIGPQFDSHSTAISPRYDRSTTYAIRPYGALDQLVSQPVCVCVGCCTEA